MIWPKRPTRKAKPFALSNAGDERRGLLPVAARTSANYRLYSSSHRQRLAFIRHCRSLDMTLDEIAALLRFKDAPQANCDGVNALLSAHVGHVAQRIRELKALQKELRALRLQCANNQRATDCGFLHGLDEAARLGAKPLAHEPPGHVHRTHGGVGA